MVLNILADISTAFILGLLTPLTAACVLPLYPGFLSYLASLGADRGQKHSIAFFGIMITAGVIIFMFLLGLLFTTIFQVSLTNVIGIISPIAFGILAVISLLLIFDIDMGRFFPKAHAPLSKSPVRSSLLYGFFFGAIVVPCNPLFIAALFVRAASTMGFIGNIFAFLFFGIGIAFPLLAFSLISTTKSGAVISFLLRHKRKINGGAGIIMLVVSIYYLVFVFRVLGIV
ncbi:MAG: cytochrome C biogenesis protein [Candidatus Aenigmarchaeota archaeon]|nr:cytochrome C biogenesis protein [Candidatus Aenigmarchaeota archaeon]